MMRQRVWQREYWGFVFIAIMSWLIIYGCLVRIVPQARVDITNRDLVVGVWAPESEGAWSNGDTHIALPYFGEFPWRSVAITWRRPLDATITATIQIGTTAIQATPVQQWRTLHLLVPTNQTMLILQSPTTKLQGDRRELGAFVGEVTVTALQLPWWQIVVWLVDLGLIIVVLGLLLGRGQWLGLGIYGIVCLIYCVMIYQESQSGFANLSLWLDRGGRYASVVGMIVWVWRRYHQQQPVVYTPPQGRRFGLDVLRAIAVMCVVVAHFTPLVFVEWSSNRDIFRWLVYLGAVGVDIFFALSGYLIGGILLRTLARMQDFAVVSRFWMRRWLRTLPAAYVSAVVMWAIAPPLDVRDYLASIFFVGTINPYHISKEIPFWWSLGAEEVFYLLFPLGIYLFIKKLPQYRAFAVTIALVAGISIVNRLVIPQLIEQAYWKNIDFLIYARLDSMIWGVLVAWMRIDRPAWFARVAQYGYAPGVALLWAGVMLSLDRYRWPLITVLFGHMLITIGAALLLPAIESLATLGWRMLDRVVVWIALISYSLYLYHVMMVIFLERSIGSATTWPILGALFGAYIALTFGAAALSYYFVEAPVLRWRNRAYPE
jgi:peptidoglycan/LPS O-acetylase OafA/YrhL